MKKVILVSIFTLIVLSGFGQGNSPWLFGLKASPSISWLSPETRHYRYENTEFGFSYGIIADRFFSESYAISSGFFITHQGGEISYPYRSEYDGEYFDGRLERVYDLQYLDIPMSIKMHTRQFGYLTIYGQFGVSLGINVSAKADDMFDADGHFFEEDGNNIIDNVQKIKASLIMGFGTKFSLLGNTAIKVGLYYNNGFTNILDEKNTAVDTQTPSSVANYLELTFALIF